MKKKLLLMFMCSIVTMFVHAQNLQITGTVKDSKGESLIGASVVAVGSSMGVITDLDGNFTLTVSQNVKEITVSYVGFTTQNVSIQGKTHVEVILKEKEGLLDDVVVVGYGTQKKATLTGAVSSISGDAMRQRPVASMSTALQGTMPGVTIQQTSGEPGADGATMRIRGIGSINSSSDPLVLVDGIEMDMNQVDMSTVESVSVLKDASSAAIYGSRASNGVILITTKRGQEGKLKVSFNSYLTIQTPTNMPSVVGAADYLQAELNSWDNAGITITDETRAARLQLIEEHRTLRPDNWNRYDTDWKDATIASTALMQNYSVSLSGGSKELLYFGSISYMDQGGLVKNNSFNRLNIRFNTDAKLLPWLKLSNSVSYKDSKQVQPGASTAKAIISKALYMLPTLSAVRELDGNWGYGKNGDNPAAVAEASGSKTYKRPELMMSATFTANPMDGLELQAQYSYKKDERRNRELLTPYATSIKGIPQGVYPPTTTGGAATLTEGWEQTIKHYYRLQASYNKEINGHNGKLLVGFDAEDNEYTSFSGSKDELYFDSHYLNNGMGTGSSAGSARSWALASFYGRFNYDYQSKYLFEFSGRYDGSSRFTRANRWGFFPSASIGWVMTSEPFMQGAEGVLDHLKLRASYGTLGNQDLLQGVESYYPYMAIIKPGYSYWFDKELSSGVAQTNLANADIKWEKSQQVNFGIDAYLFRQKLGVTFDYYIKDLKDMLMNYPIPYYAGMSPAYTNAGDMSNRGWELKLTYRDKIGEVGYSVTGTLSNNENEIKKLYGYYSDNSIKEGYPKGGIWGYKTDGYFQDWDDVANSPKLSNAARPGYVKYVKVDPNTDPSIVGKGDQVYLGDPFPHFEYGLNLNANWKNFDLTVFFQGVGKRKVMMSGIGLKPFANGANLFKHQLDSWTPENPNAAYPILVPEANSADNFATSDKWVKDGAYLRLKNVVLGYTLPKSVVNKLKISDARFYVGGQNLFTISSFYDGYDPEVSYSGSLGGEFYPIMQTFTFGVDIKF